MDLMIAANWKMHKTIAETEAFLIEFKKFAGRFSGVEVLICPPYTALAAAHKLLDGSGIKLGAQNMFFADHGAYTGEISPVMLKDLGVEYVIIGHSERRRLFGEDEMLIRQKVEAALLYRLKPILCVGETESERERGFTDAVLKKQLYSALEGLRGKLSSDLVIAYEPVWAIGTGRAALPADAESAASLVCQVVQECLGTQVLQGLRVQYGGSVKADNIGEFTTLPSIHGALVGGASLEAAAFAGLIMAAREAAGH